MSREAKASGTIRIGCPTSRRFSRSTSHNTMRDVPAAIGWTVNLQEGLPSAFCQRWKGFSKGFRGGVGERQRRHGYAGKSLLLTCGGRDFQGFPGRRCRKATPTRIRQEVQQWQASLLSMRHGHARTVSLKSGTESKSGTGTGTGTGLGSAHLTLVKLC